MPLNYTCDRARRRITVVSVGAATREEILAVIDRQAAEGGWSFGVLYDTRQGTTVPTGEDLHRMVLHVGRLTTKHGPRGPVALVVRDPQHFIVGSRYSSLGDLTALNVKVCTSIEEADDWLDGECGG